MFRTFLHHRRRQNHLKTSEIEPPAPETLLATIQLKIFTRTLVLIGVLIGATAVLACPFQLNRYLFVPILIVGTGVVACIFPTDDELHARWGRLFLQLLFAVTGIGVFRHTYEVWNLGADYSSPASQLVHHGVCVLRLIFWARALVFSEKKWCDLLSWINVHGVLTVLAVLCLQLFEHGTLCSPPYLRAAHHMIGAPAFVWALITGVAMLLLSQTAGSKDARRRICNAVGLLHTAVPLTDLQGLILATKVATPTAGFTLSVSPAEAPVPLPLRLDTPIPMTILGPHANALGNDAGQDATNDDASEADSIGTGLTGGFTESVASTSLVEDDIGCRQYINTATAVRMSQLARAMPAADDF